VGARARTGLRSERERDGSVGDRYRKRYNNNTGRPQDLLSIYLEYNTTIDMTLERARDMALRDHSI